MRPHEKKTILAEGRLFPKNGKQSELRVCVARPGMLLSTEHWILLQHNDWFNKHHLALQAIQVCKQKSHGLSWKSHQNCRFGVHLKLLTGQTIGVQSYPMFNNLQDSQILRLSGFPTCCVAEWEDTIHCAVMQHSQSSITLWSRGSPQNVWQEDCSWEVSLFHVAFLPVFCGYKAHNIGGCRLDPPWSHGIHVQSLRSTDSSSLWVHLLCDENPNVYVTTKTVTLFATFCHKAASGQTSIQFQSCLFGASPRQDRSVLWPQHCCCSTPSQVQDDSIFWRLLDTFWLHQATSSDIKLHQPQKKQPTVPQQRKKKVQRWAVNLLKPLHASLGILAPWITWITGKSHRLRGKTNEKSFQWELVLPC